MRGTRAPFDPFSPLLRPATLARLTRTACRMGIGLGDSFFYRVCENTFSVEMMARHRAFFSVSLVFQVLQSLTRNVRIQHKDIAQLLRLAIVSAKSKIYSPRRRHLSPGNRFGNNSCLIIHQRQKLLPVSGLILLKLKHASNRPIYLCTRCGSIGTSRALQRHYPKRSPVMSPVTCYCTRPQPHVTRRKEGCNHLG